MSTDWIAAYTANLDIRDQRENQHRQYIDAYTELADRTSAALPRGITQPSQGTTTTTGRTSTLADRSSPKPKLNSSSVPPSDPAGSTDTTTLRTQLSAANTARATLTSQLATLQSKLSTLQSSHDTAQSQLLALRRQVAQLETRVRDRDEELRGKSKLVESVQDEMVGLTLALNIAEEKVKGVEGEMEDVRGEMKGLRKENEELVQRWLRRVGEEAERAGISGETDYQGRGRNG